MRPSRRSIALTVGLVSYKRGLGALIPNWGYWGDTFLLKIWYAYLFNGILHGGNWAGLFYLCQLLVLMMINMVNMRYQQ